MIEILDLVGVFAFAMFGAHKAINARFDVFGVLTCGALTAFGGGTIRELLLNGTPAYLQNYSYLIAAIVGIAGAITLHNYFRNIQRHLLVIDAIGIAVFAFVGASRAEDANLGLAAMVLFAVLTAVGGGIISDIISGHRPEALYKDFYPLAAIILAIGYYLLRPETNSLTAFVLIAMAVAVRLISIRYKWKLWKPYSMSVKKLAHWRRKFIPLRQASS